MTASPIFWCAVAGVAIGGAVAGSELGTSPVLSRSLFGAYYQQHPDAADDGAMTAELPPPDHYPLVTPQGTVPVAALRTRGLYSQARFRAPAYGIDYPAPEFTSADYTPPDYDDASLTPEATAVALRDGSRQEPITPDPASLPVASQPVADAQSNAGGEATGALQTTLATR